MLVLQGVLCKTLATLSWWWLLKNDQKSLNLYTYNSLQLDTCSGWVGAGSRHALHFVGSCCQAVSNKDALFVVNKRLDFRRVVQ